jgi:hypothetical protein
VRFTLDVKTLSAVKYSCARAVVDVDLVPVVDGASLDLWRMRSRSSSNVMPPRLPVTAP